MSTIIVKHNLQYHSYADDTQVYLQCDNAYDSIKETINRLEKCIADVSNWMKKNSLKINEDKTEFIIFHNNKELIRSYSLQVEDNSIKISNSTKILGVSFDQKMTLNQHITSNCKSTYFQTRRINSIRQYLTSNAVKHEQSIVISRLDYCNIVCIVLPMKSIHRLQLAQNAAARVVKRTPKRKHMTPVLRDLHWLPIITPVQFKILLPVFKSLYCEAPSYVCDLLNLLNDPNRQMKSANTSSLVPNRNETITFGKQLKDTASASLWSFLRMSINLNNLIINLRNSNIGCKYRSEYMGVFGYADDLSLLCPSFTGIKKMLNICEKYARKYDILFNATKSQLLYFGKDSNNDNVQPVLSMDNGKKISYVIKCLHLGNSIRTTGTQRSLINNAIADLNIKSNNLLVEFLFSNSSPLSVLFKSYSMNIHGSTLWRYNNYSIIENYCVS